MPEHRGADEDFDMPPGYDSLHGMVECWQCGEMVQSKPNIETPRCPNCGADVTV